jgi:hypothetical protein
MKFSKHSGQSLIIAALLVVTSCVIYGRWFNFAIFSYGDWYYRFIPTLVEQSYPNLWLGSIGFGSFNELAWRVPFDVIMATFSQFGYGLNISEKFLILWPLALLSMVAPYVLLRQMIESRWLSYLGAFFYATNTYFLTINSQGHQLLVLGFNLLTLSLGLILIGLRTRKLFYLVGAVILLFFAGAADFRVLYIGGFMILAFLIFFWPKRLKSSENRLLIRNVSIFLALLVGVELYSLVSIGLSFSSQASGSILGRSLFGSEFWDLSSAISLQHPFWTGQDTSWFQVNSVKPYYWLIPLLAFGAVLLKWRNDKRVLFFAAMALVGILLSKQISEPLDTLYPFLFEHFPGFNAFREATKFYYPILIAYTVLIVLLFETLLSKTHNFKVDGRYVGYALASMLVLICIFNATPYVTGSIQKITSQRSIPEDYASLQSQLSENEKDTYFRTLWIPAPSRWSYYDNMHPRISAANLLSARAAAKKTKVDVPTQREIIDTVNSDLFEDYLSSGVVKYVIVPIRDIKNQNDFFPFYGDSRQPYIDSLANKDYLVRLKAYTDLAVFENKNYDAYIHASSSVYSLGDRSDFENTKIFLNELTGQNPDFTLGDNEGLPGRSVEDVFEKSDKNINENGIVKSKVNKNSDLYIDTSTYNFTYEVRDGQISIYKKGIVQSGSTSVVSLAEGEEQLVQVINVNPQSDYSVEVNGKLYPVDTEVAQRSLGSVKGRLRVVETKKVNLVKNNSFEDGLWQKNVTDCDNYDSQPKIKMWLNGIDSTLGSQSLTLSALRHTACTASDAIGVIPGKEYVLTFDYKAPYSDQLAYRIISADSGESIEPIMTRIEKKVDEWRTISSVVRVPENSKSVRIELRGLPPGIFSLSPRVTSYDNIRLVEAAMYDIVTSIDGETRYKRVETTSEGATVEFKSSLSATNLVANGSLESGLWQEKVGDCNNYDDNPRISMRLLSGRASAGNKYLELSSQNHIACTGPPVTEVSEGSVYLLSFDHSSPNSNGGHYYISFDDSAKSTVSVDFESGPQWQAYQRAIRVPIGAKHMDIKVHAEPAKSGKGTNNYDNFKIIEIPDLMNRAYSITKASNDVSTPNIATEYVNPSERTIKVLAASGPFYLSMAESFHQSWYLSSPDSTQLKAANSTHFKMNNQYNGWYLDPKEICKGSDDCELNPDGSYDINLVASFKPQRLFSWSVVTSVAVLLCCCVYLILVAVFGLIRKTSQSRH